MKHKERLDVLLVSLGLAESRAKAQATDYGGRGLCERAESGTSPVWKLT